MQNLTNPIPLSLYIHLPWCVKKCPYCDFNSHTLKDSLPEELYVAALIKDLHEQLPKVANREIKSIFFGGGTPSLFSPNGIDAILQSVSRLLPFSSDIEITLEANPGTVDESRFVGFRSAGVNRLSLGLQSLQEDKLKLLGRIHDRSAALRAITAAKKAGFSNFNLDLMHGLPTQTLQDALQDLQEALDFSPPHLSWYQLTIEPNTLFHHKPPTLPADDVLWEIQEKGKELLMHSGLNQYEVSAFASQNKHCRHNVNYWEYGDYLGIGAGAHSKLTVDGKIIRHWQVKNPKDYLNSSKPFIMEEKVIANIEDIIFEFMLNGLRLTAGIAFTLFESRTGLSRSTIETTVLKAQQKRLLCEDDTFLRPTELGQRFLNDLVEMFLTPSAN